ncbi:MAG: protein serine phosphatase with GAF(s) sensor(s) [Frankiales bacterium]|nr:protein serine phosphatase with GAF(s) sensor(s) [Frankiales bacterium]
MAASVTTLPPTGRSAAAARRTVESVLGEAELTDLLDEALLLVTELVTNAVVHAGTDIELHLATSTGGLRVEVVDRSPGSLPVIRPAPAETREGGRGVFLLDALATEWGTRHFGEGKSVWFQLGPRSEPAEAPVPTPAAEVGARPAPGLDWLVGLPADLEQQISSAQLIGELVHRLVEAFGLEAGWLFAQSAHDEGVWDLVAASDATMPPPETERLRRVAQAGPLGVMPGDRAELVLPLRARAGLFGALVMAGTDGLTAEQVAVARLVGDRISVVLRDDRAQASQLRSRGSLALLAEASEMFAGTLDVQLALTLATQFVVPRFAAWAAVCTTYDDSPRVVAVAHNDETRLAALRVAMSSTEGQSLTDRLSREVPGQRTVLVPSAELPPDLGEDASGDVLVLPLVARGRLLGLILVGRPTGSVYGADDVGVLTDLARRAALAVDNARLYEERSSIAKALQASLLPPNLPTAPGLEFGGRYAAAGEGNEVGGDFYDVFSMPTGGWGIAIGDVCGKGAEAAAITGMARDVLRLLVRDGAAPPRALQRLNESILELDERGRFCTAALGIVEPGPEGLRVRLSSAGHPPPVLVDASGDARFVGRSGTLLGVVPDVELSEDELLLSPGETLVFYTDGVTERRSGADMFGESRLLECVRAAAGRSADLIAGHLESDVRRFGAGPSRDDLAVLVIRCTAVTARETATLRQPVGSPG